MKLQTTVSDCKEIFVETSDLTVTVNTWANFEGASIMVHGKDTHNQLPLRMAGAFR